VRFKAELMNAEEMRRALYRIAHEIVEANKGVEGLALVGIHTRGIPLAERLSRFIQEFEGQEVPVGILDITLYRDDLSEIGFTGPRCGRPASPLTSRAGPSSWWTTSSTQGRTARAALDALMDLGRPRRIYLAVLVDRGHRELPIRADFVGKNVPTAKNEVVKVKVAEVDGEDRVELWEKEEA
jgi:pyrimidine operon attenuation protein/uracil phosphoribosyltransferase